jgi:hypothetical protein
MAARTRRIELNEKWKDGVRVGNLMNRLQKCAEGEIEMTQTQLKATEIILKKLLPDMKAIDQTVSGGLDLQFTEIQRKILKDDFQH